MSKVYFSKEFGRILDTIDYSKLGKKVAIKLHFGEKGCNTYIDPNLVRMLYNKLVSLGKQPTLVECNVLYKGSRTDSTSHIATARSHGFDMPIDLLDGEKGKDFIDVDGCKLGKGLKKYDSLIALTHFKGHMMAGFGGSIKNLGMGLGSRAGKLAMHANVKPAINSKCVGCGTCVANCDVKAIKLVDKKAVIDPAICIGCAMCIAVCPVGAASIPWGSETPKGLQEKIAKYAKAVLKMFPDAIFINVLQNITVECDCMGITQEAIMPDIGVLYSTDIVAIDKAGLDIADKYSQGRFRKINEIDKDNQIEAAVKEGIGKKEYELIEIK
mgnify:CR=1 FL=1